MKNVKKRQIYENVKKGRKSGKNYEKVRKRDKKIRIKKANFEKLDSMSGSQTYIFVWRRAMHFTTVKYGAIRSRERNPRR